MHRTTGPGSLGTELHDQDQRRIDMSEQGRPCSDTSRGASMQ